MKKKGMIKFEYNEKEVKFTDFKGKITTVPIFDFRESHVKFLFEQCIRKTINEYGMDDIYKETETNRLVISSMEVRWFLNKEVNSLLDANIHLISHDFTKWQVIWQADMDEAEEMERFGYHFRTDLIGDNQYVLVFSDHDFPKIIGNAFSNYSITGKKKEKLLSFISDMHTTYPERLEKWKEIAEDPEDECDDIRPLRYDSIYIKGEDDPEEYHCLDLKKMLKSYAQKILLYERDVEPFILDVDQIDKDPDEEFALDFNLK